jgi:hypothetical protein
MRKIQCLKPHLLRLTSILMTLFLQTPLGQFRLQSINSEPSYRALRTLGTGALVLAGHTAAVSPPRVQKELAKQPNGLEADQAEGDVVGANVIAIGDGDKILRLRFPSGWRRMPKAMLSRMGDAARQLYELASPLAFDGMILEVSPSMDAMVGVAAVKTSDEGSLSIEALTTDIDKSMPQLRQFCKEKFGAKIKILTKPQLMSTAKGVRVTLQVRGGSIRKVNIICATVSNAVDRKSVIYVIAMSRADTTREIISILESFAIQR